MKATAVAPSNIAFIKYWGRADEKLRLPSNASISMNLSNLLTTTTVEFGNQFINDEIMIDGKEELNEKIITHLDRVRKLANTKMKAKVVSQNNFPKGTGLSSSASGFAALSIAATDALGLQLSEKELTILARQGSGSACRSIPDGFVEWTAGKTSKESFAYSLYPADYWDILDIVVILTEQEKDVATSKGQQLVYSSPFYQKRLDLADKKITEFKTALENKNFTKFGEIVEQEALELHAIMLTSSPSLIYWQPETITIMKFVKGLREKGVEAYFTLNTGQNVHVICQYKDAKKVANQLRSLKEVKALIINTPSIGAQITNKHLF